jgi:hypothetical protein
MIERRQLPGVRRSAAGLVRRLNCYTGSTYLRLVIKGVAWA